VTAPSNDRAGAAGLSVADGGWTWEEHQLSEGFSCIVYDEHGRMVADHLDRETAAKIAAAPDLSRDLQSAWAVLSLILENGWVPEQHREPVEQCRDNADSTLSKARAGGDL
jgi:hypothetical protein